MPKHFTSILMFVQSLPQMNKSVSQVIQTVPQVIQTVPQVIETLPQIIQTPQQFIQTLPQIIQTPQQFIQTLPKFIQTLPLVSKAIPQIIQTLPQIIQTFPQIIPFEVKCGILLVLIILSYISHVCYLQRKVATLENTVAELYKRVATLESECEEMKQTISDTELILGDCDKKVEFMFTNISYLQKAIYKKLECEERYKDRKKEPNLAKNRQQANQEYLNAEMTVARRFTEG